MHLHGICVTCALLMACAGSAPPPRPTAVTNEAADHPQPRRKKAAPTEEVPTEPPPPPQPGNVTEKEPEAEKCAGSGWTCVKVNFEKKSVEKRETKLLGDPKIEATWSKTSDGRAVTFDHFSKGPVELMLRRKPGDKNEVVVKLGQGKGAAEVIIDQKDAPPSEFSHVGAIAAEQEGSLLVDIRYMQ